jgi:hypothetical protein
LNINNTCPTCRNIFIKVEDQVEIKFNTCNYRFIITFCGALFGVMAVFGFLGVMAFTILSKKGNDTGLGTNGTSGTNGTNGQNVSFDVPIINVITPVVVTLARFLAQIATNSPGLTIIGFSNLMEAPAPIVPTGAAEA